jgi:hypothetical protein
MRSDLELALVVSTLFLSKTLLRPRSILGNGDLRPKAELPMTPNEGKDGIKGIRQALIHAGSAGKDD